MSLKKITALLLCLLFLAEALAACDGGGGTETPAETTAPTETEEPGETKEGDRVVRELSDVPNELRYDGTTFCFATRSTAGSIYAEEIKGEKVNDAVYQRNSITEERFGIKIEEEKSDGTKLEELVQSVNAGEQRYAAAMTHITKMCDLMRDGYNAKKRAINKLPPFEPAKLTYFAIYTRSIKRDGSERSYVLDYIRITENPASGKEK